MRTTLLFPLVLLLAACAPEPQPQPQPPAAAEPAAPRLDFAAKQKIPVALDMHATADGGRAVAISGAWRGEVDFDGGDRMRCAIDRDGLAELAPGTRHEVYLLCSGAVRLADGGGRGVRVTEDGREIASGLVLP